MSKRKQFTAEMKFAVSAPGYGIANYGKYLSYFDPYVATGKAKSVTARELAAIVLRE